MTVFIFDSFARRRITFYTKPKSHKVSQRYMETRIVAAWLMTELSGLPAFMYLRIVKLILSVLAFLVAPLIVQGQVYQWFKGNTHTHTTVSDGNAAPEFVVKWYHDRGYHFLVVTDHNKFVDPDSIPLPMPARKDFILIPGEEVTGKRAIHTTGLNVHRHVHPGDEYSSKAEVIQSHVDSIRAASGIPILNHPNFQSGAQVSDIYPVERLNILELFNGHPYVYNYGKESEHISVEAKWDSLLTRGRLIYGISSDDAHHYDTYAEDRSNPGRGWIMVRSIELTRRAIVSAIESGEFYSTNGVILSGVDLVSGTYSVSVDEKATKQSLSSPYVIGRKVDRGTEGFLIEFIGPGGMVMQKSIGVSARYKIASNESYIRCRITYRFRNTRGTLVEHYAWTQPVFSP